MEHLIGAALLGPHIKFGDAFRKNIARSHEGRRRPTEASPAPGGKGIVVGIDGYAQRKIRRRARIVMLHVVTGRIHSRRGFHRGQRMPLAGGGVERARTAPPVLSAVHLYFRAQPSAHTPHRTEAKGRNPSGRGAAVPRSVHRARGRPGPVRKRHERGGAGRPRYPHSHLLFPRGAARKWVNAPSLRNRPTCANFHSTPRGEFRLARLPFGRRRSSSSSERRTSRRPVTASISMMSPSFRRARSGRPRRLPEPTWPMQKACVWRPRKSGPSVDQGDLVPHTLSVEAGWSYGHRSRAKCRGRGLGLLVA